MKMKGFASSLQQQKTVALLKQCEPLIDLDRFEKLLNQSMMVAPKLPGKAKVQPEEFAALLELIAGSVFINIGQRQGSELQWWTAQLAARDTEGRTEAHWRSLILGLSNTLTGLLDRCLDAAPVFVGECWRGVMATDQTLATYEPGAIITDRGFLSATKRLETAEVFAAHEGRRHGWQQMFGVEVPHKLLIQIESKSVRAVGNWLMQGFKAAKVQNCFADKNRPFDAGELLFPRGAHFTVRNRFEAGDWVHVWLVEQ